MKSTEVRKLLPEAWGEGVMGRGGGGGGGGGGGRQRRRQRERERGGGIKEVKVKERG